MQVQAMLEAVWAQHREAWEVCVEQARRVLNMHSLQLEPPTETRRIKHGHSVSEPYSE
jgi:hypothetical protein